MSRIKCLSPFVIAKVPSSFSLLSDDQQYMVSFGLHYDGQSINA